MGRSKKLTESWGENSQDTEGLSLSWGAWKWLFTLTRSVHVLRWLGGLVPIQPCFWISAIPSQRCCGHSCWVLFQAPPSQEPRNPCHLPRIWWGVSPHEAQMEKIKTLQASASFSSNICREGEWHEPGECGAYCSHYIKIQIGWRNIPSITALHWYFYNS